MKSIKINNMEKVVITMSQREYKKFLAFKEADKIVRNIKRDLKEVKEAREGKRTLKSACQIHNL
jgi:predicted AlkP superfamily phosphohydrolase/phosphomutase